MANLYRKKPLVIEAVQWLGDNAEEVVAFAGDRFSPEHFLEYPTCVAGIYDKLHGTWIRVEVGDWILKGVKGEFYPCNEAVFAETYERNHASEDLFGRVDLGMNFTASSNMHAYPMSYSTVTGEFAVHEGAFTPPLTFAFFYSLPHLVNYAGQSREVFLLAATGHICDDLADRFGYTGDLTVIMMPVIDATFLFYAVPEGRKKVERQLTPVGIAKEATFGTPLPPTHFLPLSD